MEKILIGICTFNNYHFTHICLKSLERNTPSLFFGKTRLRIIDNNSTDGTIENILRDFPWIYKDNFIESKRDCIPAQWNQFVDILLLGEHFLMAPNDIVFGPNWLELLYEDTFKNENVICGSPYINNDLYYDNVINQEFADNYNRIYPEIRSVKTSGDLSFFLGMLYDGDFDQFCLDFQERNKNEPPIDNSLTHVLLFKNKLFSEYNYRFNDIDYPDLFGSHEFQMIVDFNNLGLFRISSSRSYCHHFISVSNHLSNIPMSEKQKIIRKNNLKLLGKWKVIPESAYFMEGPRPKNIPNWKTPYYKFEKREPELSEEEAAKQPGTSFMVFCGLKPGENYFNQIQLGSILGLDNKLFEVIDRGQDELFIKNKQDQVFSIWPGEFLEDKWSVVYYFRAEEKELNKYWSERML